MQMVKEVKILDIFRLKPSELELCIKKFALLSLCFQIVLVAFESNAIYWN